MTTTTLSRAISTTNALVAYLASVTGVVAQTTFLLVNRELMSVNSITLKGVSVTRGLSGTQAATHASGATVYVLTAADFANNPLGQGAPSFTPVNPDVEGIDFPDGTRQTTAAASGLTVPVSIANGGIGAATAAAKTIFGNATTGTAAPAFTAAPLVNSVTLAAVAPTAAAAQVALGSTTQGTVGAAGAASALPATPTGYLIINVAGTAAVIPYYAAS